MRAIRAIAKSQYAWNTATQFPALFFAAAAPPELTICAIIFNVKYAAGGAR